MKSLTKCIAAAALLLPRAAHAEFPSLDTAIKLAKEHALVVSEAEGQIGIARRS